jgi:hypothetical protein
MMRNLIVLGCAGLLAIGLSVSSFAGSGTDTDLDGLVDTSDDCVDVQNGPAASPPGCYAGGVQLDGDMDGYGNPCDTDTNNDGATGLDDVAATFAEAAVVGTNPVFDFNCDGAAGLDDVAAAFADASVVANPGPSGLACAGSIPCP